jgi:hypothetical protein
VELGGLGSRSGEDEGRGGEGEESGELHVCVFCCARARKVVRRFLYAGWMRESDAVPRVLNFLNVEKCPATYTPFRGLFSLMSLLFRSYHGAPSDRVPSASRLATLAPRVRRSARTQRS